jgi:hypothetical protein
MPLKQNFEKFSKSRLELPDEYKAIYEKIILENRNGETKMSSLSQKMEIWLHKQIARTSDPAKKTLEIGAGTLNQLKYEPPVQYDIIEPFEALYKNSPILNKINRIYKDISEIPGTQKYDRITSCACFEHILNLPEVMARSCKLLNKHGVLCVSIPNEGRFLWKLGWKLTTGREFSKRYGLDYSVIMRHEHVNTADEIETILKYFFRNIWMKVFGINKVFALYRYYECKEPDMDKAEKYLKEL